MLCLTRKRAVFLVSKSPKPSYFCNSNFQSREVCKPAERKPGHLCQRECPLQQAEATKVGDGPPRSNSASDSRAKHASGRESDPVVPLLAPSLEGDYLAHERPPMSTVHRSPSRSCVESSLWSSWPASALS